MNSHSKVARRIFVIFIVLVCGGWYSDNRANHENVNYIEDLFVYKAGGERNTNAVQSGQRGKLTLAERQGNKRKQRPTGVPNSPILNKNRYQAGKVTKMPKSNIPARVERMQGRGSRLQKTEEGGVICSIVPKPCSGRSTDNPCPGGYTTKTSTRMCTDDDGNVMSQSEVTYCCPVRVNSPITVH